MIVVLYFGTVAVVVVVLVAVVTVAWFGTVGLVSVIAVRKFGMAAVVVLCSGLCVVVVFGKGDCVVCTGLLDWGVVVFYAPVVGAVCSVVFSGGSAVGTGNLSGAAVAFGTVVEASKNLVLAVV